MIPINPTDLGAARILTGLTTGQIKRPLLTAASNPLNFSQKPDSVHFSGNYAPKDRQQLSSITEALKGWDTRADVYGPDYLPPAALERTIFHVLEGNASIPPLAVDAMATRKTRAMNLHALLLGRPLYDPLKIREEAEDFLIALDEASNVLDGDFARRFNFSKQELSLIHRFMSKTASILYEMGFPDPVRHAAQVSRLCVIQASKQNATHNELLQAAMVGWLHDPKLASELSRENLATHPVIGSAIALSVFNDPSFRKELQSVLTPSGQSVDDFAQGVAEALSINNDSKWVLSEVILKALNQSVSNPDTLGDIAIRRFTAPYQGMKPPELDGAQQRELSAAQVPSGLRGLNLPSFDEAIEETLEDYPELDGMDSQTLLDAVLECHPPSILDEARWKQFVSDIEARLKTDTHAVVEHTVQGLLLFSHHQEVQNGKIPALALASSDPLLLSPHKILEAVPDDTCLKGIRDFMRSFANNVTYVPKETKAGAREWQRDLYKGILLAAQELTGRDPLVKLPADFATQPVKKQAALLEEVITSPSTWQAKDGTDYGAASLRDAKTHDAAERLLETLKRHYDMAAETSPALFGATPAATTAGL